MASSSWKTMMASFAFSVSLVALAVAGGAALSAENNSISGSCSAIPPSSSQPLLAEHLVRRRIQSGRVYAHPNFLSDEQLNLLRHDMHDLESEGKFIVNGLSDVRKGLKGEPTTTATTTDNDVGIAPKEANQGFDVEYDRSVCPIPWWKDVLSLKEEECSSYSSSGDDSIQENDLLLRSIQIKLQRLRYDLSRILERPTMVNNELGHECYYSQSTPGSSLARHMDERHEETKGPRGWLSPSRRSLSWLIYLSEGDRDGDGDDEREWDAQTNGGLLRTFPQKRYRNVAHENEHIRDVTVECGSHNGNLQVGWLITEEEDNDDGKVSDVSGEENSPMLLQNSTTHPVFLDSWFNHVNPYTGDAEPHCILYIVQKQQHQSKEEGDNHDNDMRIEYLTVPWSIDAVGGGNVADFLRHHAKLASSLFTQSTYARQFHLLEDRDAWTHGDIPAGAVVEDFAPLPGMLVVFDSVTLPHEVTAVTKGRRSALAGWFHEETQPLGGNIQ